MVYGNIKYHENCTNSMEVLEKCLQYILKNDLHSINPGLHKIDSDKLYFNIIETETSPAEKRFWEAHKKYIDVHYIIKGKERIALNYTDNLKAGEYKPDDDFLPLEGNEKFSVTLEEGDFLLCSPEDAHMTLIAVDKPELIKKAVFKVKI